MRRQRTWSGLCTAGDRVQLNAFLRRCMKLGYRERDAPSIEEIFAASDLDDQLFSKINNNTVADPAMGGQPPPPLTKI